MANPPQQSFETCTHERRPGTTVCLHCRHAERQAARDRRKRLMLRGSAIGIVVATLGAAGVLSATALRDRVSSHNEKPAQVVASSVTSTTSHRDSASSTPTSPVNADAPDKAAATNVAAVQQGDVTPHAAMMTPIVPEGESIVGDGITAARTDSMVVLMFDTPMLRTRIPEKFEQFVRTTLPRLFGPRADSALARMPDGAIAGQGALLTDLPTRGVHVPVDDDWSIVIYPETRPGQDGPLVVRYRASVVPNKG